MTDGLTGSQEGRAGKKGLRLFCRRAGGRFEHKRQAAPELGEGKPVEPEGGFVSTTQGALNAWLGKQSGKPSRPGIDPDPPPIFARPLQRNLHIPLAKEARKFFSPLDQQNAVFRAEIIEAKSLQLARGVDPIEIDVVKIGARSAILMHERERGAGDGVFFRRFESGGDSFDQRGFSGAEIAAQQHQPGRRKQPGQAAPEGNGFLRRTCGDLAHDLVAAREPP
jgi:hypothetical protein